jgi:hypothetical protein
MANLPGPLPSPYFRPASAVAGMQIYRRQILTNIIKPDAIDDLHRSFLGETLFNAPAAAVAPVTPEPLPSD